MDSSEYASESSLHPLLYGYTGAERMQLEEYLSEQKQVNGTTPPTFIFENYDDKVGSSENNSLFYEALVRAGVPSEGHILRRVSMGLVWLRMSLMSLPGRSCFITG